MSILISRASGNLTSASTWELVDATSYSNSESNSFLVTTSYQNSSDITYGGSVTLSGVAIKLATRAASPGVSDSLTIAIDSGGSDVAGTPTSIYVSDLPSAATADLNGGWIFIKFNSPVTLTAGTYRLKIRTSASNSVTLFGTASPNWARMFVTTTTQAPVAGDDMVICKEHTGVGTGNSFVVTMDETTTTDYGSGATSLVTPAIAICNGGSLIYGVTASTNYMLKVSGNIIIYSGGTYQQGGVGAETPHDSRADLQIDCSSNVIFGITPRNLCNFITQGLPRTSGKVFDRCFLNTDEAIDSTSLSVTENTGWLNDDVIAVASTTRTNTQCEKGTLNGDAGASTLTVDGFAGVGGGLAFAHSGTAPTQAEVILLTRNVSIFGASASLQTFIDIKPTAIVDCDWTEFYWMGSATANKRGIDIGGTTGTQSFNYCSLHDFTVTSSRGFNITSTSGSTITIENCVTYGIANNHIINVVTTGTHTINNVTSIYSSDASSSLHVLADVGITYTNITLVGANFYGLSLTDNNLFRTLSNIISHSNGNDNINISGGNGIITNLTSWRSNGAGITLSSSAAYSPITINNLNAFGNNLVNVKLVQCVLILNSPILNGDTTFSTALGIWTSQNNSAAILTVNSGNLGTVSGIKTAHTTADLGLINLIILNAFLNNTILASPTDVTTPSLIPITGFISSQKHNQTTGLHKTWKKYGTIFIETFVTYSGGFSMKMTPNNSTFKLESAGPFGGFKCPVVNGQSVTPTIYIAKATGYIGSQPRFIVKRNDALGISADTVLDTATSASDYSGGYHWEALTGTTATVTDDGILEFIVDCDGTAGSVYIDKLTVV